MRPPTVLVVAALATIACQDKAKPTRDRSSSPDPTETAEAVTAAAAAPTTTPQATETVAPAGTPPAKPKGTVTIGKPTSDVAVPEADLVINSFAGDLSRCYEDALARAPTTAGRFEIVMIVETTGSTVGAPRVDRANGLPAELTGCMAKAIGSARFRGFAGHRATVHVPITLALGANAAAAKK